MNAVEKLIDQGIKDFSSAKLSDSGQVVDLLLDIRNALGDNDGQEDHQEEAEGRRVPEPV